MEMDSRTAARFAGAFFSRPAHPVELLLLRVEAVACALWHSWMILAFHAFFWVALSGAESSSRCCNANASASCCRAAARAAA